MTDIRQWLAAAGGVIGTVVALAPGWTPDRVRLRAAIPFEVRVVAATAAATTLAVRDEATGETLALREDVSLDNADLAAARVVPTGATFGVEVTFTTAGTAKVRAVTRENVGRRIAVIVDGRVIASPVVRTEVADLGVLSGRYSRADARGLPAPSSPVCAEGCENRTPASLPPASGTPAGSTLRSERLSSDPPERIVGPIRNRES